MASKQRLKKLAMRDLNSECSRYETECSAVHTRIASFEEIEKYKNIIKKEGLQYGRNISETEYSK